MPLAEETSEQAESITGGLQTLSYSPSDAGQIAAIKSESWQPVNEVNRQAWEEIERHINHARRQVAAGRRSCLYYYMIANQMSPLLLARYTRQAAWKPLLHLLPFVFKRLTGEQLRLYADLFQVTEEELRNGALQPAVYQAAQRHE